MPSHNVSSDEEILTLFSNEKDKEKAFTLLVQKYQQDMYYSIRRVVFLHDDAADVLQNVFIKVWKHLDKFRKDSSLKTWLTRICINEALTFVKNKKEEYKLDDDSYADRLLQTAAEEKSLSSDRIQSLVQQAIAHLPEKQRVVFSYRYFDEMSYEEMSRILDTSVGALKASYHFARQKVEEFLKKNN